MQSEHVRETSVVQDVVVEEASLMEVLQSREAAVDMHTLLNANDVIATAKALEEGDDGADEPAQNSKELQVEFFVKMLLKDSSAVTSLTKSNEELNGSCHMPKYSQQELVKGICKLVQSDESGRSPHSKESLAGLSNGLAEAVAAGIAEGVAEGIAESLVETITNNTGGALVQSITLERGDLTGKAGVINIVKTVAEVIAEGVAYEVAQGLADGLAEAAAIAEQTAVVENQELDNSLNAVGEDADGVLCDCGKVTVVRVMGKKSPNRGLRYLMCAAQEPSFFKYKCKRKVSDAQNCRFFQWVDAPRHVKVDGNEERQKIHQRDLILQQEGISFYSTRSAAKRGHVNTVETSIPPTLEAHDVSVSPLPLKGPKASQALLGMPEADLEKTNKQTGREKANADLNQKISLVSSTSPTGISGHHTRAIAKRVAPIYNVVEALSGSEQQDLHNTRPAAKLAAPVSADGQEAVSLSAKAFDDMPVMSIGNSIAYPPSTHTEKKFGHQISRTEAIEMDHKGRVSIGGQAGDSSSSGALVGDSHHATRSLDTTDCHSTRSVVKKGMVGMAMEQGVFPAGTQHPVLGKQATNSLEGPPGVLPEKLGQVRKRRSFRAEVHRNTAFSLGGIDVKRSPVVGSSGKKDQYYTRRSSTGQDKSTAENNQNVSGLQDDGHMMAKARAKRMEIEDQSQILWRSATGDLPTRTRHTQNLVSHIDDEYTKVEFGRRKHSQSQHHQQRELPLSEVYGTAEPLLSTKMFSQNAALQRFSPPSMFIQHDNIGDDCSRASGKKRKQSQEYLLVDDFSPDVDSSMLCTTKKGKSTTELKEYSVASGEISFPSTNGHSGTETRIKVQCALKLPADEYLGPDDPWSLDGPWVEKKVVKAPGQSGIIPEICIVSEPYKDAEEKENVLDQTPELPETLPASVSQAKEEEEEKEEEKEVHRQPTEISETSSILDSRKQVNEVLARAQMEDMVQEVLDAAIPANGNDTHIECPHKRQDCSKFENDKLVKEVETSCVMKDTGHASSELPELAVDDCGVNIVDTPAVAEVHTEDNLEALTEGQCSSNSVWTAKKLTVREDASLVGGSVEDPIRNHSCGLHELRTDELGTEDIEMAENVTDPACDEMVVGGENDGSVLPVMVSEAPPDTKKSVIEADLTTASTVMHGQTMVERIENSMVTGRTELGTVVCGPAAGLDANCPTGNVNSGNTLIVETVTCLASVRTDDVAAVEVGKLFMDMNVTAEEKRNEATSMVELSEVTLTHGKTGLSDLVSDHPLVPMDAAPTIAHRIKYPIAVSQGAADKECELTGSEQELAAPGKVHQDVASIRTPAAGETAGLVSSVWRLSSGTKTRSVGSIGELAVPVKRPRSVTAVRKYGHSAVESEGNSKPSTEAQWVHVPLDWKIEKSVVKAKHQIVPGATVAPNRTCLHVLQPVDGIDGGTGNQSKAVHGQDEHVTSKGCSSRHSTDIFSREEEHAGKGSDLEETAIALKMKSHGEVVKNIGTADKKDCLQADLEIEQAQDVSGDVFLKVTAEVVTGVKKGADVTDAMEEVVVMDSKVVDGAEVQAELNLEAGTGKVNMNNSPSESLCKIAATKVSQCSRPMVKKLVVTEQLAHQIGNGCEEHMSGTANDAISPGKMEFTAGECELSQTMKVVDDSPPAEDMGKHEHWTHVEKAKKTNDRAEASEPTAEAVKEADYRNVHQDGNGVQLERFATNLEQGSVKFETMNLKQKDQSKIQSEAEFAEEEEVGVPHCDCKLIRRLAVMKTVTRNGDANLGLRYWGCSNYQVTFVKKRKQPNEIEEESCKFFRWFDTPQVTAMEKKERRKEHYRQVELQRLL
ncbi:hypothetical protein BDL97_05G064200 [Sphagnum fallax]|nr:hypothetical protein BDL97_05G064200 [Sphagnum fallax]